LRILPLPRPVIVTTLLLSVVESIKFFELVHVVTGGGPNAGSELLATYTSRQGLLTFRFGYATATAMLLLSLAPALFVLVRTHRAERTP
jgi:raffinose/stachyose/melibiose transport system permease protein